MTNFTGIHDERPSWRERSYCVDAVLTIRFLDGVKTDDRRQENESRVSRHRPRLAVDLKAGPDAMDGALGTDCRFLPYFQRLGPRMEVKTATKFSIGARFISPVFCCEVL